MKSLIKISVFIMLAITVVILILGTRQIFYRNNNDFSDSFVIFLIIALFFVLCLITAISLFIQKFSFKKIGFYMLHIGIIVSLAGFLIYYVSGIKMMGMYRINEAGSSADAHHEMLKTSRLKDAEYIANFTSFNLGVTEFTLEKYDVVYDIYLITDDENYKRIGSDIELDKEGNFDFGKYGKINGGEINQNGIYVQVNLDENVIAVPRNPDKFYQAKLAIYNSDKNETSNKILEVNRTQRVNGWKIYLMGYNENYPDYVTLLFKYDPGEYVTLAGIWMIIIGSLAACFPLNLKREEKKTEKDAGMKLNKNTRRKAGGAK